MLRTGSYQQEDDEEDCVATGDNIDPVAYAEFMSSNNWEENSSGQFCRLGHIRNNINPDLNNIGEDDLNGHIVKLKTKSEELFAIVDSEAQ